MTKHLTRFCILTLAVLSCMAVLSFGQLEFDGTDDAVICGDAGSVKSFFVWGNADTASRLIANLSATVTFSLGATDITTTNVTSPTYYVDGVAGATFSLNKVQLWGFTTDTAITADAVTISDTSTDFDGDIYDVLAFPTALTATEVGNLYRAAAYPDNGTNKVAPVAEWGKVQGNASGDTLAPGTTIRNFGTAGSSADGVTTNGVKVSASVPSVVYDEDVVVDRSGTQNNGSNNGATLAEGSGGVWSFDFNGSTDYLQFPDNDALSFGTNSFTIAAQIELDTVAPDNQGIFDKAQTSPANYEYRFLVQGWSLFFGQFSGNTTGNNRYWKSPANTIAADVDYFVAAKYDHTTDTLEFWRDGREYTGLTATTSGTFVAMSNTDAPNHIGSYRGDLYFMNGEVKRLYAFTENLSSNQLQALWVSNVVPDSVVAEYRMTPPAQPAPLKRKRR